jgi:hypothetical protein
MKRTSKIYSAFQAASAVFMMLALLWLTISLPYVYESQQKMAKEAKSTISDSSMADSSDEENSGPVGAEEKNPNSNNSVSEEYLHDAHVEEYFFSASSQFYKCVSAGIYIAYHGELDVPPPDAA